MWTANHCSILFSSTMNKVWFKKRSSGQFLFCVYCREATIFGLGMAASSLSRQTQILLKMRTQSVHSKMSEDFKNTEHNEESLQGLEVKHFQIFIPQIHQTFVLFVMLYVNFKFLQRQSDRL